jgi:NDP-sugar pyrophosphorylase family protein
MKKIYFLNEDKSQVLFEYSEISELREELKNRRITIGKYARIGENATIGNRAIIGSSATIGDSATIGYFAKIGDHARIGDSAKIGNRAIIGDSAKIGNRAIIGDSAKIGNRAIIGNSAIIGDHAIIGNSAIIGDHATIGKGIELKFNLYIKGSAHPVTYTGNNTLSIGCKNYTIEKWLQDFENIGINAAYNETQIEEYKQYILIAEQFSKI